MVFNQHRYYTSIFNANVFSENKSDERDILFDYKNDNPQKTAVLGSKNDELDARSTLVHRETQKYWEAEGSSRIGLG